MSNSQPALSLVGERNYASLAQILGILGFLPSLIIWLTFKDRSKFVNSQVKEALNWQITWIIVWVALLIISFATVFVYGIGLIYTLLQWALWVLNVILSIVAFTKNTEGAEFKYFVNFRFIK